MSKPLSDREFYEREQARVDHEYSYWDRFYQSLSPGERLTEEGRLIEAHLYGARELTIQNAELTAEIMMLWDEGFNDRELARQILQPDYPSLAKVPLVLTEQAAAPKKKKRGGPLRSLLVMVVLIAALAAAALLLGGSLGR